MDEAQQFSQEWDLAQQRYRAGVNAGYSDADADQLYLEPVRNKWEILKSVPAAMQPQASRELDAAQVSFLKGVNAGYKPEDSSNLYLKPSEQKWVASASVKTPPPVDPLLAEKQGALQEVIDGYDPMQVMRGHPQQIFSDPKFVARFQTAAEQSERGKQKAKADATKAAAKDTPVSQLETLNRLANIYANKNFQAQPPAVIQALQDQAGQISNRLTNAPTAVMSQTRFSFNPPTQIGTAPAAPDDLNMAPPTGSGPKYLTKYKTAQDVGAAYRSKELSRDEAKKILADQFGIN